MKASLSWLEERVKLPSMNKNELAMRLTLTGTKVEEITSVADKNSDLIIGKVLRVEKHPEADRLVVTTVDNGKEILQIVTGAPNVYEGALVVVAGHGTTLAGGVKIKNSKLRGVESQGMLCSLDELGYSPNVLPKGSSEIVIILDEGEVGESFFSYFGLDKGTLDLEITYNRPDCLSIMGIAKELASTFDLPLEKELSMDPASYLPGELSIVRKKGCHAYYALEMQGVTIKESPFRWQLRLMEMGVRPINNVVDATNLAMLYSGNPTHAFDQRQVKGGIIVEACEVPASFQTLDGVFRQLEAGDLLIKDHEKIIGLAGIMGGENSQILDDSTDLIVEFANFDATAIMKTSRRLGMRTEASSRFEKELEPERTLLALSFFLKYMQGQYHRAKLSGSHDKTHRAPVSLRRERAENLLGVGFDIPQLEEIFKKLHFDYQRDFDLIRVYPPVYRSDLLLEADLVEEVARIYGYENIPSKLPSIPEPADLSSRQKFEWNLRDLLWGLGFEEMLNYSFVSPKSAASIHRDTEHPLRLINPLGEEFSQMRHSLLISALDVIQRNENVKNDAVSFFEIGNVFEMKEDIEQSQRLSLARYGEGDFFTLKGLLEEVFASLGIEVTYKRCEEAVYHRGRCAEVYVGEELLGSFGELSPFIALERGMRKTIYLAEFSMDKLYEGRNLKIVHEAPSRYPAILRDLALLVDKDLTQEEIYAKILSKGGRLLRKVELFDLYFGKELGENKKSMAYHCHFQSSERTLKDEEVEDAMARILKGLEELGAQRR